MRHRHRWPYILVLPLWLLFPSLLATASPTPLARTRHQQQRQVHRLVGGHLRISDSDDSELITASAGENTKNQKGGKKVDDERKTLAQQVADGKYGLIQKELFKKPPKRPGIISYAPNPEVPKDNIATLGGLTKNDIWLAENHLLVIKGGTYPPHDDTKQDYVGQIWQPIDDYSAPLHQVKIPKNPAVPPPFPVQLTDDGPLQILGTNSSRTLNASAETPAYALPPPPGWDGEIPPQGQYFPEAGSSDSDPADPVAGQVTMRVPDSGELPGGLPFPPALLNGSLSHFFARLPPGAAILPAPLKNETNTDILDEDDPSIYYPPPYSFYYPKDNTSLVPPGPLVPGIILPPPPKFFAPLEEPASTITTRKPAQTHPTYTTKHFTLPETTTEPPLSNEISTGKPLKPIPTRVSVVKNYSKVTVRMGISRRPQMSHGRTTKLLKTTIPTTGKPKLITILPVHVDKLNRTYLPVANDRRKPPVTVLRPVKPEVATPKVYSYQNEVTDKPPKNYQNRQQYDRRRPNYENDRHRSRLNNEIVSTTQVPLRYHATANDVEETSVTPGPEKFSIGINAQPPKTTVKGPANYYFYEETDPALNAITTAAPIAKQNAYYYVKPTIVPPPVGRKPQFIYVTGRPYDNGKPKFRQVEPPRPRPQNSFSVHIAKLQNQLHQYHSTPKPVYQYSFEAQNYQRPGGKKFRPSPLIDNDDEDSFRPIPQYSVEIQPAIEIIPTQRPSYQQVQQLHVEEPTYYSTETPQSAYNNNQQYLQEVRKPPPYSPEPQRYAPPEVHNNPALVATPSRPIAQFSFEVTPNPINQGYYTKPDEGYFDENTKQYFTIFGRKLPSSTTPLPPTNRPSTDLRQQPVRSHYSRPMVSLHSDINVNYARPRPPINPQSELIRNNGQYHQEKHSPNPEIVKAIEITPAPFSGRDGREQYVHYQLPGDEGAHFYFLTPQAADRRRQAGGYFFEREGRVRQEDRKAEQSAKKGG